VGLPVTVLNMGEAVVVAVLNTRFVVDPPVLDVPNTWFVVDPVEVLNM